MSIPTHLLDPPDIPENEVICEGFIRLSPCPCGSTALTEEPPECLECSRRPEVGQYTDCTAWVIAGSEEQCYECGYVAPDLDCTSNPFDFEDYDD